MNAVHETIGDGMSQIFKLELLNEFQTTLSGII